MDGPHYMASRFLPRIKNLRQLFLRPVILILCVFVITFGLPAIRGISLQEDAVPSNIFKVHETIPQASQTTPVLRPIGPDPNHFLKPITQHFTSGIQVPVLTAEQFYATNWSNEARVVNVHSGVKVYYNFTTLRNEHTGTISTRYIYSRFFPYHDSASSSLSRRGYIVNPTVQVHDKAAFSALFKEPDRMRKLYSWVITGFMSKGSAVVIPMCYQNAEAEQKLEKVVDEAIEVWHTALGENRGVELAACYGICNDKDSNGHIRIVYAKGDDSHATTGYKAWSQKDRHNMVIDPDLYDDKTRLTAAVHELGHILGLHHEHQRYDAKDSVVFNCQNVKGYDEAKAIVSARKPNDPDFFERVVCNDWDEARAPDIIDIWRGYQFIPHPKNTMTWRTYFNYETVGPFDWDSIMLYPSGTMMNDKKRAVLQKRPEAPAPRTWGTNHALSKGDIGAVRLLYPDITNGGPSASNRKD